MMFHVKSNQTKWQNAISAVFNELVYFYLSNWYRVKGFVCLFFFSVSCPARLHYWGSMCLCVWQNAVDTINHQENSLFFSKEQQYPYLHKRETFPSTTPPVKLKSIEPETFWPPFKIQFPAEIQRICRLWLLKLIM